MLFIKPLATLLIIFSAEGFVQPRQLQTSLGISRNAPVGVVVPPSQFSSPFTTHGTNSFDTSLKNSVSDETATITSNEVEAITPRGQYDSIVCGGGPAGLLTAIMLSQKYGPSHRIAVCERRPAIPPSPSDATVWNDVARFYLLGIGHRGQNALKEFGVLDDFVKSSVAVNGRRDWQPGKTALEDGRITPSRKGVVSRILARDKLVSVLHHHIVDNYGEANIDLLYGYEVEPVSFGNDDDDKVTVRISKCVDTSLGTSNVPSQEAEQECDVDNSLLVVTSFLVGADGSARTVANAMEQADAERFKQLNPLQRVFASKPFKVTRYIDDNQRVYKSVPISLPADWPCDLNYSARSTGSRITLEALPSDDKGNMCALLLMRPDDAFAQADSDPAKLRAFFDEEFPQFSPLVDDDVMAAVASKPCSTLPAFRYAGPKLNVGRRTIVLGDAAHTVKPYYGLGANTALEDVVVLSTALDDAAKSNDANEAVPEAVRLFSDRRAGDSQALVQMSRHLDRPGKMFLFSFLLPLILDGIFNKLAPKVFGPNMFVMFSKQGIGFRQIQRKKRLDRVLQATCITLLLTGAGLATKQLISTIAKVTGRSQPVIALSTVAAAAFVKLLQNAASRRNKQEAGKL